MAEQLTFDLPREPALGRGDFFVSPSNAAAVEAIQGWHDWPDGKLVLVGPKGAGKTHLAHVWAAMTGARIVAASELARAEIPVLAEGPVVVEDADRIAGDAAAEKALFHLHNLARERRVALLITASMAPGRWGLALPDLQSRVQGSGMVSLAPPDDALISAVLVKLFADRQLDVAPDVVAYLAKHMERSFEAAGPLVAALDQAALAEKRAVTRPLAAQVLDKMRGDGP
ncbi:MAG: DnaA/Hda family protein [Rhodobacter sp.]|nr:DnaA/Hda family protein [Rhodobacter sp.]